MKPWLQSTLSEAEALVRKLCDDGQLSKALQAAFTARRQGLTVSNGTICHLLKVCLHKKDLLVGRQVQSLLHQDGLESVPLIGDHLIRLFASCGSLRCASEAFFNIKEPTIYTWNAIISAHVQLGDQRKALGFYKKMLQVGTKPDVVTLLCVVKACAGVGDLMQGRGIHGQCIRHELKSSAFSNSLIDMYAKCGSIEDARRVFDRLGSRSIVSWGALLVGYVETGDAVSTFKIFEQMKESGIDPNRAIFLCLVKACICVGGICQGRLVHHEILKSGLDSELMVCNALMDFYVKVFCLDDALKVFDNLPCPDIVSWDIRIAGLADNGFGSAALESYSHMQLKGLKPDKYTYSCVLKACAIEGVIGQGKLVHDQVLRSGHESNVVVNNTLIDMYGKCACIEEACKVFQSMTSRDAVSWSTMIVRCVELGFDGLALQYVERMHEDPVHPNKAVYVCALKACVSTGTLVLGRVLHDLIIRGGLETNLTIGTTLVNMYGNHGSLEEAGFVLNSMENPNEVTWGLMVTACVQHNYFHAAAGLIVKMLRKEMNLDKTSVMGVLKGCSKSGTIVYGRLLHSQLIESGLTMDNEVKSALIDMYAKCGSPRDSCKASEGFAPGNNVVLWDAKIASFAYSGCFESVQHCLRTMERQRVKPDRVIFVGLLSACSSVGVLEEGCQYFTSMRSDYGIEPGIDEYNTMIELLGRVGLAEEAEAFLLSMPLSPGFVGWMSLLSSCTDSYRVGLGRSSFEQIVKKDPYDASGYVLMASIYAGAHMWQDMMAVNYQERQANSL